MGQASALSRAIGGQVSDSAFSTSVGSRMSLDFFESRPRSSEDVQLRPPELLIALHVGSRRTKG